MCTVLSLFVLIVRNTFLYAGGNLVMYERIKSQIIILDISTPGPKIRYQLLHMPILT